MTVPSVTLMRYFSWKILTSQEMELTNKNVFMDKYLYSTISC